MLTGLFLKSPFTFHQEIATPTHIFLHQGREMSKAEQKNGRIKNRYNSWDKRNLKAENGLPVVGKTPRLTPCNWKPPGPRTALSPAPWQATRPDTSAAQMWPLLSAEGKRAPTPGVIWEECCARRPNPSQARLVPHFYP